MIDNTRMAPMITPATLETSGFREKLGDIVMTKGVYDLTHYGHIVSLWEAKDLGNTLIVAIAGDESVRQRKGPGRPILSLDERIGIISSLRMVDYVTIYDETSPLDIVISIRPKYFAASHFGYFTDVDRENLLANGVLLRKLERPNQRSTSDILSAIHNS